jgi:hypothetical protein
MALTQPKKRSSYNWAFFNQYNYILLGGAAIFAVATFSWLPLLVGAGAEALWMALGADTSLFRRWVLMQEGIDRQKDLQQRAVDALKSLDEQYVDRYASLEATAEQISKLAQDNPSLERSLVDDELAKLGQLLNDYLQMAVVHQRLSRYLDTTSSADIDRDISSCEDQLKSETNLEVQASLRQNLALAEKRQKQHDRIDASHKALTVKIDTLEKSFEFLKSHILAIGSQEDLRDQLDSVISGISSAELFSSETDDLLADLPRPRAAVAAGTRK